MAGVFCCDVQQETGTEKGLSHQREQGDALEIKEGLVVL